MSDEGLIRGKHNDAESPRVSSVRRILETLGHGGATGDDLDALQVAIDADIDASRSYNEIVAAIRMWTSSDGWTMIRNDRLTPGGSLYRADVLIANIQKMRDEKGKTSLVSDLPPGPLARKLAKLHRLVGLR